MNQEKIGKFISTVRKEKKITQKQLAEKLGITDRAISKWENGKSMPDLALLKPLCDILNISINELLSGEYINKKNENLEDNIVNVINYSKKKQLIHELIFEIFIIIFGILIFIMSMSIFDAIIDFYLWYSVLGTFVLIISFGYLLKYFVVSNKSRKYIIITILSFFLLYYSYLWTIDFINVKKNKSNPNIFVITTAVTEKSFSYNTLFYDLHICNINQNNEYRKLVFDLNNDVDFDEIDKYCNK